MTATAPRVFISYSHDSDEHRDRVLELADRLRADGIDAVIDQYVQSPPEGWPAWCEAEIRKSDFVPMICTETYIRRVNGEEEPGKGRGVLWEARLIKQHLYDARLVSNKFIPVLLADGSGAHVPTPVKGGTVYRVETLEGYDALLRLLTDQPLTPMPALGRRRSLPPKQRRAIASLAEPARPLAALPHPRSRGSVRWALRRTRAACRRALPGERHASSCCRLGDGGSRQVVFGGPLLLGKRSPVPQRLSAAGLRPG
jgi:hypothetical protein